jgi:putative colanic acid biosynthesis acetyltransferase WcaF
MQPHDPKPFADLAAFDNAWYDPGRSLPVRLLWTIANACFFLAWLPWPSRLKAALLRAFGARVGVGVVIKPRVNIKYPWNLQVGDHAWIGESVWLDSLALIVIGESACLSQGCMVETGNHDWSSPGFDLVVKPVVIGAGAWAAVRSMLLPGSNLAPNAVLGAGSVLSGDTEPSGIYVGVPAVKVSQRRASRMPADPGPAAPASIHTSVRHRPQ